MDVSSQSWCDLCAVTKRHLRKGFVRGSAFWSHDSTGSALILRSSPNQVLYVVVRDVDVPAHLRALHVTRKVDRRFVPSKNFQSRTRLKGSKKLQTYLANISSFAQSKNCRYSALADDLATHRWSHKYHPIAAPPGMTKSP